MLRDPEDGRAGGGRKKDLWEFVHRSIADAVGSDARLEKLYVGLEIHMSF